MQKIRFEGSMQIAKKHIADLMDEKAAEHIWAFSTSAGSLGGYLY